MLIHSVTPETALTYLMERLEDVANYRRRRFYEAGSSDGNADFAASRACQNLVFTFREHCDRNLIMAWADWYFGADRLDAIEALNSEAYSVGVTSHPADANAFLTAVLAHKG